MCVCVRERVGRVSEENKKLEMMGVCLILEIKETESWKGSESSIQTLV